MRTADCAVLVGGPVYNTTTDVMLREDPFTSEVCLREENGAPVRGVRVRSVYRSAERTFRRRVGPATAGPCLESASCSKTASVSE